MKIVIPGGSGQVGTMLARRLLDQGFTFEFPSWPLAALDLCERWRLLRDEPTKSLRTDPEAG